MNEQSAKETLGRVLKASRAEYVSARLNMSDQASTRYSNNVITQNLESKRMTLTVRVSFGNREGVASTGETSDSAVAGVVKRAEDIATVVQPNPEHMPPVEPQEYCKFDAYHRETAECSAAQRAQVIRTAASICEKSHLTAAGSFHTGDEDVAVMNSTGLFAFNSRTNSRFSCTAISPDSSGKCEASNEDVTKINAGNLASFAVERALKSRSPREIEPGRYTVILEPPAVAELLMFMMWGFDARAAHEGRSFMSGKEGVKMVHDSVNIFSRPGHEMVPGRPFNEDGMPCPEMHWIRAGVVENLHYGRYWAKKCGRAPTGYPSNLIMDGGKATLDEMIASTKRGVLVSRFWYVRHVDWMAMLLTGMTRDGTFLIEDGKIVCGVRNMRFNDSPARLLGAVEMLGPQRRCGEWLEMLMPTIKASGFNFTSKTRF